LSYAAAISGFWLALMNFFHACLQLAHVPADVDVSSLDEYAKKVEGLGGRIKVPEVPGNGWFVLCIDIENNMFDLWEPKDGH
jgi:predicted enzyme related to lactoylglutathione lyase